MITEFPLPTANSYPVSIASGPDGHLWFTELDGDRIGRISTTGTIQEFLLPSGSSPSGIALGPDGHLWFTRGDGIGRISTTGTIQEFPLPSSSLPLGIALGPDGHLWFTEGSNRIGCITGS